MASLNTRRVSLSDLVPPDLVFEIDGAEFRIPGKALTVEAMAELAGHFERWGQDEGQQNPYKVLRDIRGTLAKMAGTEPPPLTVTQALLIAQHVMTEGAGVPLAQEQESSSGNSSASGQSGSGSRTKK